LIARFMECLKVVILMAFVIEYSAHFIIKAHTFY